jgi:hypothetical protein
MKLAILFVLCASTCGAFGQSNAAFYGSTTGSDSNIEVILSYSQSR